VANVRCRGEHSGHLLKNARSCIYVARVEPLNYSNTSVICGKKGCTEPGLVHLDEKEWQDYQNGQRFFNPHTLAIKVKLGDTVEVITETG